MGQTHAYGGTTPGVGILTQVPPYRHGREAQQSEEGATVLLGSSQRVPVKPLLQIQL